MGRVPVGWWGEVSGVCIGGTITKVGGYGPRTTKGGTEWGNTQSNNNGGKNAMQCNGTRMGLGLGGETENEKHECTDIPGGSIKDARSMRDEAGSGPGSG